MRYFAIMMMLVGCASMPIEGAPRDVEGVWCRVDGEERGGGMSISADGAVKVSCSPAIAELTEDSVIGGLSANYAEHIEGELTSIEMEDGGAYVSGWVSMTEGDRYAHIVFDGWADAEAVPTQ